MLYQIKGKKVHIVQEKPFKLEKDLQLLFEDNLKDILGLSVVKTEFSIANRRFDTLAFDETSNSFVIIEYKKKQNDSVVDQGFTYLGLMLNNKSDFILALVNKGYKDSVYNNIDWSKSRVIFVSPRFTEMQKQSINFPDLPIDLLEITKYSNDTMFINKINKTGTASYKPLAKTSVQQQVAKDIKVYAEQDHLNNKSEEMQDLYESIKNMLLSLYPFTIEPQKFYIAYKKQNKNVCDIVIQKKKLMIYFNAKKGSIKDYKNLLEDISNTGALGNGDYRIDIKDDSSIDYIKDIVSQILN